MINNITKTLKIGQYSSQLNPLGPNTSLKQLALETQTLRTKIVNVDAIGEAGDVIFTTLDGEKIEVSNVLHASIGDKIRIAKNTENRYVAISIYQKSTIAEASVNKADNLEVVSISHILKTGSYVAGNFIPSDDVGGVFDGLLGDSFVHPLDEEKTCRFRVISLNNNMGDDIEPQKGVLGTLNEILSDNEANDQYIACKVVMQDGEKAILSTKFGNIIISQRFQNMPVGTDLILSLVDDAEKNIELNKSVSELILSLNKAALLLRKNGKIAEMEFSKLAFLFVFLMRHIPKKSGENDKLKNPLSVEKLLSDQPMSKEESDSLLRASDKVRIYAPEVMEAEFCEVVFKQNWCLLSIPFKEEDRTSQQKIYVQRKNLNIIRLVADLDMENIGLVQLDIIISSEGRDLPSRMLKNIDVKIRHKNKLDKEFFTLVRNALHNSLLPFNIKSTVLFEESSKFLNNFQNDESEEDLHIELGKKIDKKLEYYV